MKKLMIAAAVISMVAFAQAASITWGGDVGLPPDGDDFVQAGSVAYLIKGTTAAEAAITQIIVDGTDWKNWTTDTGATIVGSHTLTALQAESNYHFETDKPITGKDDAGYYSVVLVDGQAGAEGLTGAYAYAGQNTLIDPTSGASTDLRVGDNWKSGSAPFIGQDGFNAVAFVGSTPTPEPTTGLLMLVGLAGLALRRRRA